VKSKANLAAGKQHASLVTGTK
jgi:hypothetical protein